MHLTSTAYIIIPCTYNTCNFYDLLHIHIKINNANQFNHTHLAMNNIQKYTLLHKTQKTNTIVFYKLSIVKYTNGGKVGTAQHSAMLDC